MLLFLLCRLLRHRGIREFHTVHFHLIIRAEGVGEHSRLSGGNTGLDLGIVVLAPIGPQIQLPNLGNQRIDSCLLYTSTRDVARLADVLGHSSIETTRIYLISTGAEHARTLDRLCLVC